VARKKTALVPRLGAPTNLRRGGAFADARRVSRGEALRRALREAD